jgi:transcriptional regulator with XRE-family HTH domain
MRQLTDLVGISNPYLSQIERGQREPSEPVLDAIADRTTATTARSRLSSGRSVPTRTSPPASARH